MMIDDNNTIYVPRLTQEDYEVKNTVVIGAGLSGLAAADWLLRNGLDNIVVLEAQDRIGGRVETLSRQNKDCAGSGAFYELGAQWFHGDEDSPLWRWLAARDLLECKQPATAETEGLFLTSTGFLLDRTIVDKVLEILMQAKNALSNTHQDDILKQPPDACAIHFFRRYFDERICNEPSLQKLPRGILDALFKWFELYEAIDNSAPSMEQVSIRSYTHWTNYGGGVLINLKGGYQSVVECLASSLLQRDLIRTNSQVVSVQDGDDFVRINYVDATVKPSELKAILSSRVIFTPSLAVLKAAIRTGSGFFNPPLSDKTCATIDAIGFGVVNKIFLEFETPLVDPLITGVKFVWIEDKDDAEKEPQANAFDAQTLPTWTHFITGFDAVRNAPNALLGWIGGTGAAQMEAYSDEQIGDTCVELIERFLTRTRSPSGDDTWKRLPKLRQCFCSRWASNKFVAGAYSYQSLASQALFDNAGEHNDYAALQNEFGGKLLFAGEANAGKQYSTTSGAVICGWTKAEQAIESKDAPKM